MIEIARGVRPFEHGKVDITLVNQVYLQRGDFNVEVMGWGVAWLDTSTYESLLDAAHFVQTIEARQGYKIASLQEIALNRGWLSAGEFERVGRRVEKTITVAI